MYKKLSIRHDTSTETIIEIINFVFQFVQPRYNVSYSSPYHLQQYVTG